MSDDKPDSPGNAATDAAVPGVYRLRGKGPDQRSAEAAPECVHEYVDDGYELADIHEQFGLGQPGADGAVLELTRHELRLLRTHADAHSFDHPPELIEMCLDVTRVALDEDETTLRLISRG